MQKLDATKIGIIVILERYLFLSISLLLIFLNDTLIIENKSPAELGEEKEGETL